MQISCLKACCVLSVHCRSSSCKKVYNHWRIKQEQKFGDKRWLNLRNKILFFSDGIYLCWVDITCCPSHLSSQFCECLNEYLKYTTVTSTDNGIMTIMISKYFKCDLQLSVHLCVYIPQSWHFSVAYHLRPVSSMPWYPASLFSKNNFSLQGKTDNSKNRCLKWHANSN
jgi:hypothetical protein